MKKRTKTTKAIGGTTALRKCYVMWATTAIHKLGDISRDKGDFCVVNSQDEENYYGNWITGFGFVEVKFPKATTRPLNEEELKKVRESHYSINETYLGQPYQEAETL